MRNSRPTSDKPSPDAMKGLLNQCGIHLNPEQLDQLWRYHNLIRSRNQDRDLTRITGFESMVVKHYVDCMIVGKFITLPSPLLDLGSGAGFPGIPIKIRYPHLKLILAEPRPRRAEFLNQAIQELKFSRVEVFDHKVVSRSFTMPVAGVITRAVETMEKTLLRTSACIGVGGKLIFMKGPSVDPEISDVYRRFKSEYHLVLDKKYILPHSPHHRRLIVYERMPNATKFE